MRFLVCLLLLLAGCDRAAEGSRAYREGRFGDAFAAYAKAEHDAGDGAPPELLFDESLAALRADDPSAADAAVERASRGGPALAALCAFVRGNVAFNRAETAERQAAGPEAEPFVFDVAVAYADTARGLWQDAATSRDDWPAARRNVERALALIERIKAMKSKADRRRRPEAQPQPMPKGDKKKPAEAPQAEAGGRRDKSRDAGPDAQTAAAQGALTPDEVAHLLDLLAERDRRKLSVRRERRDAQAGDVEKDW